MISYYRSSIRAARIRAGGILRRQNGAAELRLARSRRIGAGTVAVDEQAEFSVVWACHGEVAIVLVHIDEDGDVTHRAHAWARSRSAQRVVAFHSRADVLRLADDLREMAS